MAERVAKANAADEAEHLRALRASLRRFGEREAPRALCATWDQENKFPRDVFEKLVALGVTGLSVPETCGGAGRDIVAVMVCIEELAKRSLALAVPYVMSACYAGMNLAEYGSDAQKRDLLPKVADQGLLFAYGWSEPDVGADVASVRTRAVREGDHLVVSGAKRFCSGARFADYIFTVCQTGEAANRYENLSIVLIPPQTAGVRIEGISALGMKGAETTDIVFDRVHVPFENLFGGEAGWNRGWQMITGAGLDVEKIEVAALALGIGEAAFADAFEYVQQRRQFGKPIAAYQSIRHKLAEMATRLHACRLMLYNTASLVDRHIRCGTETSMTKMFVTEAVKQVVLEAQTIFGAYGYVKGFDIERHVRDALLMPIIGGSTAIQLNNIMNWSGLGKA